MNKRITAAAAAFIATALLLTGCNNNSNNTPADTTAGTTASAAENTASKAAEIADKYFPGSADTFTAWKGVDKNKLIATVPEGNEAKDFFDITFGEFYNEYMYYLVSYGISDDMAEDHKAACESYRDNIISYLTFERMYLYAAEHEYGITEETLTDEQKSQIKSDADMVKKNWATGFYNAATEALGEDASEEDKAALCTEVLDIILDRCGLDSSIFYKWEVSRFIQDLVINELVKSVGEVTDADVQNMFDEFVAESKDKAENDPATYESLTAYAQVYVPEGTRTAKQIVISYAEDDLNKIAQALNDNDLETVATASLEAYNDEIKAKVAEIVEKLKSGADFDELRTEYDSSGSSEMIVLKNSPSFFDAYKTALYDIPEKGGVSDPIIYSNGIYFVQYSDDAQVFDDNLESIKTSMKEFLTDNKSQSAQNNAYKEWSQKFPYTIDYETIKVDPTSSVLSGMNTNN